MSSWTTHTPLPWVLFLLFSTQLRNVQSLSQPVRVRVCENKHCKKRYANLKQCVSQLLPEAEVESSGCLSHCNDGPNMEIDCKSGTSVLNGVEDVTTAAILLEQTIETSVPKILLAASKLMEQVPSLDAVKGLTYLNSVISKLETSEYATSPAMARALLMRAELHLQSGEASKALEDSQRVLELKQVATSETLAMAYRIRADTEENKIRVIAVLQQWQKDLPEFRTKLQNEIQRILESVEQDGDDEGIAVCLPNTLSASSSIKRNMSKPLN